jgi:hypothetical protein
VKRRLFVRAGAVALIAAAVGAGCGSSGSGSDRLSQSEYQAKLQSIGGDLKDAMSGTSLNSAKSAEEVANAVAKLRKRLANAANAIDGLSPPENAEKANHTLAGALHESTRHSPASKVLSGRKTSTPPGRRRSGFRQPSHPREAR